jgi:hypothetical protein
MRDKQRPAIKRSRKSMYGNTESSTPLGDDECVDVNRRENELGTYIDF